MHILALVDQSVYSQSVIDHAAWVAATTGASVELLHAVFPHEVVARRMPVHPGGLIAVSEELTTEEEIAELAARGEVLLSLARSTLVSRGITDVRTNVVRGRFPDLVQEAAAEAGLVIMGKRGEDADFARLPLGAHVERTVRAVDGPVLVVSRAFRPIHQCLLPLDLDPASAGAVETLATGGFIPPMPVRVLHVGPEDGPAQSAMASAEARLAQAGFDVTTEAVDGDPPRVIAQRAVADGTDIVVMGAFGRSRLKSLIFGSLTSEVMRACQTPILLCK